jgi:hypothetical protein
METPTRMPALVARGASHKVRKIIQAILRTIQRKPSEPEGKAALPSAMNQKPRHHRSERGFKLRASGKNELVDE